MVEFIRLSYTISYSHKSITRITAVFLLPMTRRGSDEYQLNLFLENAINGSSSDSSIGGKIFRQLKAVASQRVADIDYEQQIARWNEYPELLDKIDKKCSRQTALGFLEM